MANYLIIETREPFTETVVTQDWDMAAQLAASGNSVSLFLTENGVLPARRSPASERLTALANGGVKVFADRHALLERGIGEDRLAEGVKVADIDLVVDRLAAGDKTIWR